MVELPTDQFVAAADCMAVVVTIAGFAEVAAEDMHSALRRCNFDLVVEYCRMQRNENIVIELVVVNW